MYTPLKQGTFALLSAGLITLLLAGCNAGPQPAAMDEITFNVTASKTTLYQDENATFFANADNTLGRDVRVDWETTGGELDVKDRNRSIQIEFDDPGDYIVSADLYVNGDRIRSDSVEVTVLPLSN